MERWTSEEIELLKKHYPTSTLEELFELFPGRSERAIRAKAAKLGLSRTPETRSLITSKTNKERKNRAWSDEEIEILKKYYPKYGPRWIHENCLPHRAEFAIRFKANSLGIVMDKEQSNWIRREEEIKENGVTRVIRVVYKKL